MSQTTVTVNVPSFEEFSTSTEDGPLVLTWKGLSVYADSGKKQLLCSLDGQVTVGMYAIMGPSGSGKTTLLNALACRLDHTTKMEGEVRLNGQPYTNTELKWMSAYVMQDDLLNGHLTVEETLQYSAELRLPKGSTKEEITARVEEAMEEMNISEVRHVIVGTPLKKGISGGERKRLCVAMELLTRPVLLFLDEPTSGLDSVAALHLCSKLKALADSRKCTVVCTIHQPQEKIFCQFDNLILMSKGQVVYQGPASEASRFFGISGFPLPMHENPADHFLDVISAGNSEADLMRTNSCRNLRVVDLQAGSERPPFLPRDVIPWTEQCWILIRRSAKEQWRKRSILFTLMIQTITIAILIGFVFFQIGRTQESTIRRGPVLFFFCINQGIFSSLLMINSFPSERVLVLRERAAGTYFVSAYFVAKTTVETISAIISPIVFSIIVYWIVGLQNDGDKFMIFMVFMVLCSLSATSLALAISTLCRTTDMSVAVLPMLFEVMRLFGGGYVTPANLPKAFYWIDLFSFVKYTYIGISLNEYQDLSLSCKDNEFVKQADGSLKCPITSGQQSIDTLGLDILTVDQCIGILISYIFIARIIAFLGLRYLKN